MLWQSKRKTIYVKEDISKTLYWKVKVKGKVFDTVINDSAYSKLLNKKGENTLQQRNPIQGKK